MFFVLIHTGVQSCTVCMFVQNPEHGSHRCCVQSPVQINDKMMLFAGKHRSEGCQCVQIHKYAPGPRQSASRGAHPYLYSCVPLDLLLPAYCSIISMSCTVHNTCNSQVQDDMHAIWPFGPMWLYPLSYLSFFFQLKLGIWWKKKL